MVLPENLFPYDPRYRAIAPPSAGIFDEPQMSLCFNVQWAAHIDGLLTRLLYPDAWAGTPETQQWATTQITALLVAMAARTPCGGDCMGECCDDIVERLDRIEALLAAGPVRSRDEIRDDIDQVQEAYEQRITEIENVYEGDITNVHPDMQYGDDNDPIRDQALCFMTRRFVDICCDWVVKNIEWKQGNQQTALTIASFIGNAADVAGRLFAETAYGPLFQSIDQMLELEVSALTLWITTVSEEQLSIFQDEDARQTLACAWYEQLKGQTASANLFFNSLDYIVVSGNADIILDKLSEALVPVQELQMPSGEKIYFIWSDLWQEAYDGAVAGIVPDCLCEEPDDWVTIDFATGQHSFESYSTFATWDGDGWIAGATAGQIAVRGSITGTISDLEIYMDSPLGGGALTYVANYNATGLVSSTDSSAKIVFGGLGIAAGLFVNPAWSTGSRKLTKIRYKLA